MPRPVLSTSQSWKNSHELAAMDVRSHGPRNRDTRHVGSRVAFSLSLMNYFGDDCNSTCVGSLIPAIATQSAEYCRLMMCLGVKGQRGRMHACSPLPVLVAQ